MTPLAYAATSSADAVRVVEEFTATGGELLVAAASRFDDALVAELVADGFAVAGAREAQPAHEREAVDGRVWLLTSGTTGRPKRVAHRLDSLTTVTSAQPPQTWLCPYAPGSYAWWQLVTLAVRVPGQDLVVIDPEDVDRWVEVAAERGVTAVSGTPTFWRRTVATARDALARLPLRQITLGGEPVDQPILDTLRALFPQARVSWIYASSEVGASIVVHDGRAGFPRSWLARAADGRPRLALDGDELVIASPHHADGLDGAVRTGDRVEIRDDRVHIVGRLGRDEINVGGAKVSAGVVRHTVQEHPDVLWASVRGRTAPMVGAVVVADVVLRAEATAEAADLRRWLAERLPDPAVPRRITVLEDIPTKETLKSDA